LTPVELNSDELKFRLSRIKVLVPRCRKPYYLHSLSRIYLSKHVYYLGIKIRDSTRNSRQWESTVFNYKNDFMMEISRHKSIWKTFLTFRKLSSVPKKCNIYLVGSSYGRFCIKFPQSRMKGERHWASSLIFLLLIKSLSANQKQELPMVAMFVNGSGQHEQYLERTFHRCFHKISLHLAERWSFNRYYLSVVQILH
jgi:hypothetical protein